MCSAQMAVMSNDSSAYQLQCAILAVLSVGLLAKQSKGRTLLHNRLHRNCCPGLVYG